MNKTAPQSGQPLSNSMFVMWRCIVAVAHADGYVQPEERAFLMKVFDGMHRAHGLTAEQRAVLEGDIETPQKISDLLPQINDPAVRAQLIYFARLLIHADGRVSPEEDNLLKKLHADQLASIDMEQVRADVRRAVADEMWRHDLARGQERPQEGFTAALDEFLLYLGIDIFAD